MEKLSPEIRVWDWPLRLFHWLLVVAIAAAFLSSEEDSALNHWHVFAGWAAALLIIFRLVWGFAGGEHSRFSDFVHPSQILTHLRQLRGRQVEPALGHNPLGGMAVLILLGLTAVTVWSGAFGGETGEELHEVIAWTLLGMVALHILAVIAMSLLQRENLVRAMVTGKKPRERYSNARDARSPPLFGIVVTLVVIAVSVYGILLYDPDALTLRATESFEQRDMASPPAHGDEHNGEQED